MEQIWERLTSPELVFGLVVRFFGVFAVLIIVMIGIWLSGCFFVRLEEAARRRKEASLKPQPSPSSPEEDVPDGDDEEAVTEEVAAVIALALSRQGHMNKQHVAEQHRSANMESSWKLMGRQKGVSRSRSLTNVRSRRRR